MAKKSKSFELVWLRIMGMMDSYEIALGFNGLPPMSKKGREMAIKELLKYKDDTG